MADSHALDPDFSASMSHLLVHSLPPMGLSHLSISWLLASSSFDLQIRRRELYVGPLAATRGEMRLWSVLVSKLDQIQNSPRRIGKPLAIDPVSGTIYCHACSDATYPDSFEALFRLSRIRVEESNDLLREQSSVGKGRRRGVWKQYEGSTGDTQRSACSGE